MHLGDSSAQEAKWMNLFNSKGGHEKIVYQTLVDLVNTQPSNYTPIIRFLVGPPGNAEADTRFKLIYQVSQRDLRFEAVIKRDMQSERSRCKKCDSLH